MKVQVEMIVSGEILNCFSSFAKKLSVSPFKTTTWIMETLGLELKVITTVMEPKVIISDLKNQTDKIVRLKLK